MAGGRKESILDLKPLVDKTVHVKLAGGREVEGVLKGYDLLLNLVLDDCVEFLQDPEDPSVITDKQRKLGLIVARGTAVTVINPFDGTQEIENPFQQAAQQI